MGYSLVWQALGIPWTVGGVNLTATISGHSRANEREVHIQCMPNRLASFE